MEDAVLETVEAVSLEVVAFLVNDEVAVVEFSAPVSIAYV